MKYLKISSKGAYYVGKDGKDHIISEIVKDDLLYLLDELTREDVKFEMDDCDVKEISNPAQKIVYENLYKKLIAMNENKTKFIDDCKQVYKDALNKYK